MPEVLKRVGRYDLVEVIGRGGAAVVYLAHQRDLMRNVALKELAPFQAADMSFAERFVEESRLAGSMNHANIVTVHEYFEDGGVPYIAMEYLPHGSLRHYVGRLSIAQIAGVLEGVLAGLSHGEARGIAHRDLKPENLLVAVDGRVKIADFGVARAYNKAATRAVVTVAGTTIGTPAYMSPEQALGADLTPATDLYSLGIVAWELFAGQVPFEESDTPVAVLYRHVHEPVPSVRTVAPEVDERLAAWLERMLAKQPEDRFPGADAAWVALEDVILELLGPRWRREARLVVDDGDRRREHTLPPAAFADAAASAGAAAGNGIVTPAPDPARARVAETLTGVAAEAQAPPTVAPKTRRRRSHTTLMRIARRHADADADAGGPAPAGMRRRATIAAIVLVMLAAAVAGVVLAQPGSGSHTPSAAELRARQRAVAAAAARRQLAAVIVTLAPARNRALTKLKSATTAREQAAAATEVEKAYAAASSQASQVRSTAATALHTMLERMAVAYGRLAGAARAQSPQQWADAQHAISADEQQLQAAVARL